MSSIRAFIGTIPPPSAAPADPADGQPASAAPADPGNGQPAIGTIPPPSAAPADPADGQPGFSPEAVFAQTLADSGYKMGTDPCEDMCWDAYKRCLKQENYVTCLPQLQTCRDNCARKRPPDSTGLKVKGPVYVSADGCKSSAPSPLDHNTEYDFCVMVANQANAPSGPYLVRFELKGPDPGTWTVHYDEGLPPGQSGLAHFHKSETFLKPGKFELRACVFAPSDPSKTDCTASITFEVK
jgi:hypothetical protein